MSTTYHTPLPTGQAAQAATINRPLEQLDAALTAMWGSNPGETSAMTTTFHTPISTAQIPANAAAINAPLAQLDAAIALLQRRFDYPTAPFVYVDSVSGNDGNAGTSAAAPLKTLGALPALTDGATVYLRKGSHWREQLEVTADNVAVLAYGTGAAPLLDCSDVIDAGDWSKTDGRTNVYEATATLDADGLVGTWVNAWEDNARLLRAASLADCDSTPGTYWVSADDSTPITFYVHTTDSDDPAGNGKVYEYSARQSGLYAREASGLTVDGIDLRRNLANDGALVVGPFADVRNCTVTDGGKHNVLCERGSYLYNVTAQNAYYASQPATLFVYNTDTAAGEDVTFENCTATVDVYDEWQIGFYGHRNTGGTFGTITLRNCVAAGCNYPFNFQNAAHGVVDGLTSTGCGSTLRTFDSADEVTHLDIGGLVHVGGGADGPVIQLENPNCPVYLHDSTITVDLAQGGLLLVNDVVILTIEDCAFEVLGGAWPLGLRCTALAAGSTFAFNRNTVEGFMFAYYLEAAVTLTSDYNTFLTNANFLLEATSYVGLTAWQAIGYDAHSTAS